MIKNIIFDAGNVLVEIRWKELMRELGFKGEVLKQVCEATVCSDMWKEYDRSAYTDEELIESFIVNNPEIEKEIRLFMEHESEAIVAFPYAKGWVKSFKDNGYNCYILSNYSKSTHEKTKDERSYEEQIDGSIYSWQVRMVKPEPEIYLELLSRYSLVPQECVFLDDNVINVEVARELGIHAILFTTKEEAEIELRKLGVNC